MVRSVLHEEVKSRIRYGLEKHLTSVFKVVIWVPFSSEVHRSMEIPRNTSQLLLKVWLFLLGWEEFISTYVDVETWRISI